MDWNLVFLYLLHPPELSSLQNFSAIRVSSPPKSTKMDIVINIVSVDGRIDHQTSEPGCRGPKPPILFQTDVKYHLEEHESLISEVFHVR